MTNEQILKKAIKKAVSGGYDKEEAKSYWFHHPFSEMFYFELIFSHDFAKAFWGENKKGNCERPIKPYLMWQYHLQQMVLEKEPLKYIEKFLA